MTSTTSPSPLRDRVPELLRQVPTPSRRLRGWLTAGLVVAALLVVGWVLAFSSVFAVKTVDVVGEQQVTDQQVLQAAAVPMGTPLLRLDVGAVADRVRTLEAVAGVQVTRDWPNGVRITVTERRPLAVIRTTDGYGVLGSDGTVYRTVDGPQPGLPFLDQTVGEASSDPSARAALDVALRLPPAVSRRVATVTAGQPDRVVLKLRNGATVDWGSEDLTERKAQVLLLLLPHHAQRYDVSAPDAPVTVG